MKKIIGIVLLFAVFSFSVTAICIHNQHTSSFFREEKEESENQEAEKTLNLYGTFQENDIIFEILDGNDDLEKSLEIPQIRGLKNKEVENKVNQDIAETIRARVMELQKNPSIQIQSHSPSLPYTSFANVISLIYTIDYVENGQQQFESLYFNYELIHGEKLTVTDLLKKGTDVKDVMREIYYRKYKEDLAYDMEEGNDVFFDKESGTWLEKEFTRYNQETQKIEYTYHDYVPDYSEYDIQKEMKKVLEEGMRQFYFTPQYLYIENCGSFSFQEHADEIVIYDKYLTAESLYENDDVGRKNLWTCAAIVSILGEETVYNHLFSQEYGFLEDNLFYEITIVDSERPENYTSVDSVNQLAKRLQEESQGKVNAYQKIAQENPNQFYVLSILSNLYYGEGERSDIVSVKVTESLYQADRSFQSKIMDDLREEYRNWFIRYYHYSAIEANVDNFRAYTNTTKETITEYSVSKGEDGYRLPESDREEELTQEEILHTKAEEYLVRMTLEEKIGQLFLVRFPTNDAVKIVSENNFGGYLFFEKDFKGKTKEQVISMINEVQNASKTPLIIAVDEEGGPVVRVSSNKNLAKEKFKSPSNLYEEGGFELIRQDTIEKSNLLYELGINLNLAPVVDVSNPSDYMYARTLKQGVELTQIFAKTVIEASKNTGVSYALKHFPGYGHNDDTHKGSSNDTRTYEEIIEQALPPFEAGIETGAEAVLISHNIIECIDKENPASISKEVHNLLRDYLNFDGVIITDDLSMGAVSKIKDAYIKAVESGNNLIITSDYEAAIKQIKNALDDGLLAEKQIDDLVLKTIIWKYNKNLFDK